MKLGSSKGANIDELLTVKVLSVINSINMSENISYCICRSSDTNSISMTKKLARTFFKFYCTKRRDRDPSLKNQFYKESSKYVHTISSSEVTSKQGTVRKNSPIAQQSNKVARYEDVTAPE
uniref:Uncharacterized protein n=1 Tax=Tetranychus urticae TaxID=32264 RepID=T1KQN2_TETUR